MSEQTLHEAVCRYIKLQYPDVMFNSDMSGVRLTKGQAGRAKMLRSSRGFPDLMILEPMGRFCGLFIELKRSGTKLKKSNSVWATNHIAEQAIILDRLNRLGYVAMFAVGFDEAKQVIDEYMRLK